MLTSHLNSLFLAGSFFLLTLVTATVADGVEPRLLQAPKLVGPDQIPVGANAALAFSKTSTRARWIFEPTDPGSAQSAIGEGGSERLAQLSRFGGLWILEAPIDSVEAVESAFASLGDLRRDVGGEAQMLVASAAVGARPRVWDDFGYFGATGQSIAILDSGLDTAHDDLSDFDRDNEDGIPFPGDAADWVDTTVEPWPADPNLRVVGWKDITDDLPEAVGPYDYHRHGTAVAGAAAGAGNRDPSLSGIAPNARLVIVKTYNFEGRWNLFAGDLLMGIDWLLANHEALRVSIALIPARWDEELFMGRAISALAAAGIMVVAPSGNDPQSSMAYPARFDEVIAVGASDGLGFLANYSSPANPGSETLDLVAPGGSGTPGEGIEVPDHEPNDSYRRRQGSSLSAGIVAGALSILREAQEGSGLDWRGDDNPAYLRAVLRATTTALEGAEAPASPLEGELRQGFDSRQGHGVLYLPAALGAVQGLTWPGERRDLFLGPAREGLEPCWASRIPLFGGDSVEIDLLNALDLDADLLLYREEPGGLRQVGSAVAAGVGRAESLSLTPAMSGWYVLVIRRIRGTGLAVLQTRQRVGDKTLWPLRLSSSLEFMPAAIDVDGDGIDELVASNDFATSGDGHSIYAFRGDGGALPGSRFSWFSQGLIGAISPPALIETTAGPRLLLGSESGELTQIPLPLPSSVGETAVQVVVTPGSPLGPPSSVGEGASLKLLFGSAQGLRVADEAGQLLATWPATNGVVGEVAVGDVDKNGVDEIFYVDGTHQLHRRDPDGLSPAGWPKSYPLALGLESPVLIDAGSEGQVAVLERRADSWWIHRYRPGGQAVVGYPRAVGGDGGSILAVSPLAASSLTRHGEVLLLLGSLQQGGDGGLDLRMHFFDGAGDEIRRLGPRLALPQSPDEEFSVTRAQLAEPRVGDIHGSGFGSAEVLVAAGAAWEAHLGVDLLRHGSRNALFVFNDQEYRPDLTLELSPGHILSPNLQTLPPTLGDFSGDGTLDLVVARANALFLAGGKVPRSHADYWTQARGGASRRACGGCDPPFVPTAAERPSGIVELKAYPNPFNPRTRVVLNDAPELGLRWELLDSRGRRLRRWIGPADFTLEGVDGDGRPLASGNYLLRASWPGGSRSLSLSLVR